jgi:hypothetical protein
MMLTKGWTLASSSRDWRVTKAVPIYQFLICLHVYVFNTDVTSSVLIM